MAINRDGLELLCWAKRNSPEPWKEVLTLGRLAVNISPWEQAGWRQKLGPDPRLETLFDRVDDASAGEDLISCLGAGQVQSMDASPYEGASIIHNLNQPVPETLQRRFDVVMDGGTLEHIFDYPAALHNAMKMVKVGGWFLAVTPSNQWCGHGLYQLGPDIFRTLLTPINGFELKLLAFAVSSFKSQYWIWEPGPGVPSTGRLGLDSAQPATLLVAARRISPVILPTLTTEQPDYVERWNQTDSSPAQDAPAKAPPAKGGKSLAGRLFSLLPLAVRGRVLHLLYERVYARRLRQGLRRSSHLP